MGNTNHLHYYLDLIRGELVDNGNHSLMNIVNTWKSAKNGIVGKENFNGIDTKSISLCDVSKRKGTGTQNQFKSHLHYYLDLLREESYFHGGYSLINIINTWKIARNNSICGENFDHIDFGNVLFNGIKFSKEGKIPSSFRYAKVNSYNFVSGHSWDITCIAFSKDDRYLITCGRDYIAIVWDVQTGLMHVQLDGHENIITSLSVTDKYVLTGSSDNTAKLWEIESGKCIHTLKGHTGEITCVSLIDNYCATGSRDHTAKIWSLIDGECVHTLEGHIADITSLSLNMSYCLTGSKDNSAKLWVLETGECMRNYQEHNGSVSYVSFLPFMDNHCITSSYDGTIKLWTIFADESIYTSQKQPYRIEITYIGNHDSFFATTSNNNCSIWSFYDDKPGFYRKHTLTEHTGLINDISVSNDDVFCLSTSTDETLKVWSIKSGKCLYSCKEDGWINKGCFSNNNKYIASTKSNHAAIRYIYTGKLIHRLEGYTHTIICTKISNSTQYCLIVDFYGKVTLWDSKKRKCIYCFETKTSSQTCVAFSSDNQYCALISFYGEVEIYSIENNSCKLINNCSFDTGFIKQLSFVDDFRILIIDGYGIISIINLTENSIKKMGYSNGIIACAEVSSNGRYCLLRNSYDYVELWDIENKRKFTHKVTSDALLSFSSDDNYYLIGCDDEIRIYSIFEKDLINSITVEGLNNCKKIIFFNTNKIMLIYDKHIDLVNEYGDKEIINTNIGHINTISTTLTKNIIAFGLFTGVVIVYSAVENKILGEYYTIYGVNIDNCNFSDVVADSKTKTILYQHNAIID